MYTSYYEYFGLFGCIFDGTVTNVSIENSYTSSVIYSGLIAGRNFGIVANCRTSGTVGCWSEVGGLVGINYGTVRDSYNTCSILGYGTIGGVVGWNKEGTVVNCYNTGLISAKRNDSVGKVVGGIVGVNKGLIRNCYSIGELTGQDEIGGTVGRNFGTVEDCYYLDTCVTNPTSPVGTALTDEQMRNKQSYKGFDFEFLWTIEELTGYPYPQFIRNLDKSFGEPSAIWDGTVAAGFAGGSGTEEDPYRIQTASQLAFFAQSVNKGNTYQGKYILLENDIELNDSTAKYWGLNAAQWTSVGFSYFKNNEYRYDYAFKGSFDGGGKVIRGIYIDTIEDSQGLFGCVYEGSVKNLSVEKSFISGGGIVGGIVAENSGSISGVSFSGTVCGSVSVGGVTAVNTGSVTDSTNSGTVYGTDIFAGGVVGNNAGTVKSVSNSGLVCGISSVGGAVGWSAGEVTRSSNSGEVYSFQLTGGVIGTSQYGAVRSCYNTGKVFGGDFTGGITGGNTCGPIENCYNTGIVGSAETLVGGITGYSEYDNISGCYNEGTVTGSDYTGGVAGASYGSEIESCFNKGKVKGSFYVGGVAGSSTEGLVTNSYNTGEILGSVRIGGIVGDNILSLVELCFNSGIVANGSLIGGIAGKNEEGTVQNCYNIGSVSGQYRVGGIVGVDSDGTVDCTYNTGYVSGYDYYGGIVGEIIKGTVRDSYYLDSVNKAPTNTYGTALTQEQMRIKESFAGFDFENVWAIDPAANHPYPTIKGLPHMRPGIFVKGIELDISWLLIKKGESKKLIATVLPENATNKTVIWTSSDNSVATVSPYGVLTAVKDGEAIITATTEDGGYTASCTVTVERVKVRVYFYRTPYP